MRYAFPRTVPAIVPNRSIQANRPVEEWSRRDRAGRAGRMSGPSPPPECCRRGPPGTGGGPRPLRPARAGRRVCQRVFLNSRRLGVPLTLPLITLAVALLVSQLLTVEDEASP